MTKAERKKQFQSMCERYGFKKVNDYTYTISDGSWIDGNEVVISADNKYGLARAFIMITQRGDKEFRGSRVDCASIYFLGDLELLLEKCINEFDRRVEA